MTDYPVTLWDWIGYLLFSDWLHFDTIGAFGLLLLGWKGGERIQRVSERRRQLRFSWRCFRCGQELEDLLPSEVTTAAMNHQREEHA